MLTVGVGVGFSASVGARVMLGACVAVGNNVGYTHVTATPAWLLVVTPDCIVHQSDEVTGSLVE